MPQESESSSAASSTPAAKAQAPESMLASVAHFFKDIIFSCGVLLVLISGGLVVTFTGELMAGETRGHSFGSQLGLIVFLCGFVFVGCKMIMSKLNEQKAIKELREEQVLLNRAKAQKGVLTVSEAALGCQLRISDTKKAFERLALTGVCRIDVTEEGELCYRFPSFETEISVQKGPTALDPELQIIDLRQKQPEAN